MGFDIVIRFVSKTLILPLRNNLIFILDEKEICMQTSLNTETPQNIIDILLFGLFGIFVAAGFIILIYRQSFGKFYMYILTISLKNENRNANMEIEKKVFLRTEKC